ncbi:hypothetical protein [Pseudactinotalea sp. Z1748]|uniref:hypothetical protein n=1 Tax=Pseudactinotalea sp. Z1748 TaxID=3413027 RepID=UPI003C7C2D8F
MSRLAASALGAGLTASLSEILRSTLPAGTPRWTRSNFRGNQVSLTGGLSTAAGAVASAAGAGGRAGAAAVVTAGTAGVLGALDDRETDSVDKGLRGHVRALAQGRLTTGGAKLLGISGAALIGAMIGTAAGRRGSGPAPGRLARGGDVLTSAALIAGTANLLNLFDLRPGRALKVAGALSLGPALGRSPGAPLATGALAVAAASWHTDLTEETMLGDAGANALGALVGTALALHPSAGLRTGVLAGVVGLTLLSEKVSFSRVIESVPALRALDTWGRSG